MLKGFKTAVGRVDSKRYLAATSGRLSNQVETVYLAEIKNISADLPKKNERCLQK